MTNKLIRGAKGGSGAQHTPVESPDNLRSIAYFRILDLVSEGEIGGLVNGQQSIFLDETPMANADGSLNFPKAHIETRTGTPDQTVIPGFDSTENEISVNVELKSSAPWVRSITNPALDAIRLTLGVPALSKANTTNGDITGYTINYKVELQTDGGAFELIQDGKFIGKTTTKFQRSLRIDLPAATTGWQLRVTRLTANANSSAIADITTIDSYTEIVDSAMAYPDSALVGVMGDASQFTNIPQRAYDLWGRIVQVPANYDVVTRAYTGTWDGTFKPSWSDNPAWIFYDICTNTRYGLGHLITAAQVDKWELYKIGQYCDELVDDGHGGMEPRFTCNIYLQTQADAYKLLNDLSTTFRGISYWANGTIVASADMPADPVYTYTDANVIDGKFSYSASARKTRYTSALVSWNDPRNFYRTKIEYVEDAEGIARYGFQQATATAVGCTSQGQAQRFGKWLLLTSRLETDTVTFSVGLDGTIAAPGQIIRVADSARAGKRQGGRVHSATTTAVTVDNAPAVAVGDTLTVNMSDGIAQTRTVSAVSGSVITVSTAFTAAPFPGAVWTVESSTLNAQTYRVLAVTEDKSDTDISFTITALQHNASKFDAVDTGTAIVVPPISALTTGIQSSPLSVTLSAHAVVGQVATYSVLTISWEAAPGAIRYEVEWRRDSGEWIPIGNPYGLSVDVVGISAGDYTARVRAVARDGNASLQTTSATLTVGDASTLPTSIADIEGQAADAQAAANAANAALANIASDGILSPVEKPVVIRDYNVITTEQPGIDAQATAYAITTQKTAYDTAVSALTSYLGTLVDPALWSDLTGNTTIVGATFRSKFADVYTTRQALLNAIYAAAKSKADTAKAAADAAQTTANAAASNVPAVINGQFKDGTNGWTFDNPVGFYREAGGSSPDSACGTYLVRQGQTGGATTYARNLGYVSVVPGQTIIVTACLKSLSANAGAYAGCRISWRDAAHAEVGTSLASVTVGPGGTYLQAVSKAIGQAPSTAQYAHFELYYVNHSSGYLNATSCGLTVQAASQDEVPDGSTRFAAIHNPATQTTIQANAAAAYAPGQNMIRNPTGAVGNLHWTEVFTTGATPEGDISGYRWRGLSSGTHGRVNEPITIGAGLPIVLSGDMYTGAITGGTPATLNIQFRDSGGTQIGSIATVSAALNSDWTRYTLPVTTPAGTAAIKVYFSANPTGGGTPFWRNLKLESGLVATPYSDNATQDGNQLTNPGSGQRLGDMRNQVMVGVGNYGAGWSGGSITYSATTTSATITAAAATLQVGSATLAYNSANVTVSGSAGLVRTYYLYYDDDGYTGGSKTLNATTSQITSLSADGRILVGQVAVTFPTSGTGGGSGGSGCPDEDAWVLRADPGGEWADTPAQAKTIRAGHYLRLTDGRIGLVTYSERKASPRVRVTDENGGRLTCSTTAPLELFDAAGECVLAPISTGCIVSARTDGVAFGSQVWRVEDAGDGYVQHITCQNACFWTGDDPGYLFGHHNLKPPTP